MVLVVMVIAKGRKAYPDISKLLTTYLVMSHYLQ